MVKFLICPGLDVANVQGPVSSDSVADKRAYPI